MRQGIFVFILLGTALGGCVTGPTMTTPAATIHIATTESGEVDVAKIMQQADFAYQQGDLHTAERGYRLAIEYSSNNNAPAQRRLGNTLTRQKRYDDAIKAYQASLAQDASKMQTYNDLALLYISQAQDVLASGVDQLPADDGDTAQVKHMLWQLKKITPENLQELQLQAK